MPTESNCTGLTSDSDRDTVFADPPASKRQRAERSKAKQNNSVGGNRTEDMVTDFTGKLKGFEQGVLLVTRDDDTEVMVKPPADISKFLFVAEASPRFLQQGMMVRFNGTFNKAGVAQSPIAKVELFQPVNGKMSGRVREKFYPGIYPDRKDARKQAQTGIAKCGVVGALVGIDQTGVMRVRAGKVPVQISLVQNVKFEIHYNNLALAKAGDEIRVSGFYNPPDETKVVADSILVKTDRVFGEFVPGESKPPPKKRRSRRRSREKNKKSDGEESGEKAESGEKVESGVKVDSAEKLAGQPAGEPDSD